MEPETLLTASAVGEILGISEGYARRLCRENNIGQAIGEKVRILQHDDVQKLREILDRLSESNCGRPRKKS